MNDKDKVLKLRAKGTAILKKIIEIQAACPHTNVVKIPDADTGNYCRADDSYWYNCSCPDCLKTWTEDQ